MNTASWPQEIVVKPMEEIITNTTNADTTKNTNSNNKISNTTKPQPSTSLERKVRPQKEQALNCPRCNSTNTKFCYYNNYSLTQPRYFCKTCRRYWTEGGSLRSIPVGGGSRKNKRPASCAFPSSNTSKIKLPDLVTCTNPSPKIHQHSGQDLNLGFPSTLSEFMQMPNNTSSQLSALELLTGLSSSSRGLNLMSPFMGMTQIPHHHDPDSVFPSGFSLQSDLKPGGINFSLDGLGNGGGIHGVQESGGGGVNNGGRTLFPFEHLKSTNITSSATTTTTTTTTAADENHHQNQNSEQQIAIDQQGDSTGYWTGILGGAGSW